MSAAVEFVIGKILSDEVNLEDPSTWAVDVGDGKGITRFGQTPGWLADHGLPVPETPEQAIANCRVWMGRYHLDLLSDIDPIVGHLVTDDAFHSGETGAVRRLQTAVGVGVDGIIGAKTLAAVRAANSGDVARDVFAEKMEHRFRLLGAKTPDRRKWANGWGLRLGRQVRTLP